MTSVKKEWQRMDTCYNYSDADIDEEDAEDAEKTVIHRYTPTLPHHQLQSNMPWHDWHQNFSVFALGRPEDRGSDGTQYFADDYAFLSLEQLFKRVDMMREWIQKYDLDPSEFRIVFDKELPPQPGHAASWPQMEVLIPRPNTDVKMNALNLWSNEWARINKIMEFIRVWEDQVNVAMKPELVQAEKHSPQAVDYVKSKFKGQLDRWEKHIPILEELFTELKAIKIRLDALV
jgi:hypothetical protein